MFHQLFNTKLNSVVQPHPSYRGFIIYIKYLIKQRQAEPSPEIEAFISEGEPEEEPKPEPKQEPTTKPKARPTARRKVEPGVRLVAYLPEDLEEWVRMHAAKTKRSKTDLVTEALDLFKKNLDE